MALNLCQKGHQANKDHFGGVECDIQDPDYSSFQNDSDLENISEDGSFKNVLLFTGPVGVLIVTLVFMRHIFSCWFTSVFTSGFIITVICHAILFPTYMTILRASAQKQ